MARATHSHAIAVRVKPDRRHPLSTIHRRSPAEIVDAIRTSKSAAARNNSIRLLEKYLRRGDRFQATWDALGGAHGVANLLSGLSVTDVRSLCRRLGRTASAINARPERRTGIEELIGILKNGETDSRPLSKFYQHIVPGSHDRVVQAWEDEHSDAFEWTKSEQVCLLHGHREHYEQRFLRDIFPTRFTPSCDFADHVKLFRGNRAFCDTILNTLLSKDSDKVQIPDDFMSEFALPMVNRLIKRHRSVTPELTRYLGLIVRCVEHHPQGFKDDISLFGFGSEIEAPTTNFLSFTMLRWANVYDKEERGLLESYLQTLLGLLPSDGLNLHSVHRALNLGRDQHPKYAEMRYHLLKLIFKHAGGFRLDLEAESAPALQRLKAISSLVNMWPVELFMLLPHDKSLALFERLERAHLDESFVSCNGYGATILRQESTPLTHGRSDVDIVRTVIQRKKDPSGATWLDGVRLLVKDRKKKATEAKEPRHRAFWATSTLNLCTAAGDLAMLNDAFVWAQRFIKDPMVGPDVHGGALTRELDELLKAASIPWECNSAGAMAGVISMAKSNIEPANKLLVTLIKTAISATREPSFKPGNWSTMIKLPEKIARDRTEIGESLRRLAAKKDFAYHMPTIANVIWKPTMMLLLDIENLMSDPSASKLFSGHHRGARRQSTFTAGLYLEQLPTMSPLLQAEMTTFFLEAMQAQLSPAMVKSHVGFVITAVSKLAHSDQPELAIPFIRPIVQNTEDSSSHRQVLTEGFLKSLPAQAAQQFLRSMSGAMVDMLRAQNNAHSDTDRPPGVKVTTIKMMADLLKDNLVVDAATSCEILVSLLNETRHIDARIAIITSLLSTLEESKCTPALRKKILDVFEQTVLPMAAQLNERRPTTEDEWHETEMPEVSDESSILGLLADGSRNWHLHADDRARMLQITMRALEQSAVNHQRWMVTFVEKHGFKSRLDSNFSVLPAHLRPLMSTFRYRFKSMNDSLLDMIQALILQNVDPLPGVSHITESIKADAKLRGSNAGKHWLVQYDNPGQQVFSLGLDTALGLIQQSSELGDRASQLRELIVTVAERWLRQGKPDLVYIMVDRLTPKPRDPEPLDWRRYSTEVIEDIIRCAETVRKAGSVSVLPNTFRLKLTILRLRHWTPYETVTESQVLGFVQLASDLIESLASRRVPYHGDFSLLKSTIASIAASVHDHARAAVALARLYPEDLREAEPSIAAYLRLETAAEGLKATQVPTDKQVKGEVHRLVEEWTACPTPELSMMGKELEAELKRKGWFGKEGDVVMQDAW